MPNTAGRLVAIHLAPERDAPLEARAEARLIEGKGVEGDRYCGTAPGKQVTLVAEEDLAAAARDLGVFIAPGATRRNLTISGLPGALVPGARIRVGEAVVEVLTSAAPCKLMDTCIADGAREALKGRSGVRAAVQKGAVVRVGDPVTPA